ncbi:hypothetical protein [Micromonospora sp. DT41]
MALTLTLTLTQAAVSLCGPEVQAVALDKRSSRTGEPKPPERHILD